MITTATMSAKTTTPHISTAAATRQQYQEREPKLCYFLLVVRVENKQDGRNLPFRLWKKKKNIYLPRKREREPNVPRPTIIRFEKKWDGAGYTRISVYTKQRKIRSISTTVFVCLTSQYSTQPCTARGHSLAFFTESGSCLRFFFFMFHRALGPAIPTPNNFYWRRSSTTSLPTDIPPSNFFHSRASDFCFVHIFSTSAKNQWKTLVERKDSTVGSLRACI